MSDAPAQVNPHTCPHPRWVPDTDLPGDKETRCARCGTVLTYLKTFYRPCCEKARLDGRQCEFEGRGDDPSLT